MTKLKVLLGPSLLLAVFLVLHYSASEAIGAFAFERLGADPVFAVSLFAICAWLIGAVVAARALNTYFWDLAIAKATGAPIPRLVKQLTTVIVFLLALTGIVGIVFDKSVTGLLTTSGAVGLLIGFAARNLILDLFSGISINLERPFDAGEYIQIHVRGVSHIFGRVEETNWRTTRISTPEGSIQVIPNSLLGESVVTNFSRPTPIGEFELTIVLDSAVETSRALRILEAGLWQAVANGGPLRSPEPKARVNGIEAHGIRYKMKYFVDPRKGGPGKVRHVVLDSVLRHLGRANLRPAFPKSEMLHQPEGFGFVQPSFDRASILADSPALSSLTIHQRETLMEHSAERQVRSGERLVIPHQPIPHFSIVLEGWLEVHRQTSDTPDDAIVDHFGPSDTFGAATQDEAANESDLALVIASSPGLVLEVPVDIIVSLRAQNPDFDKYLTATRAERHTLYEQRLEDHIREYQAKAKANHSKLINDLVGQIRGLFSKGLLGAMSSKLTGGAAAQSSFAEGLMAACALVSTADGSVDDTERAHVRNVLDSVGLLSHLSEETGMALFEKKVELAVSDQSDDQQSLFADIAALSSQHETGRIILSICRALAAADGYADADEEERIGKIAEALGLAEAHTGHYDERMTD